MIFRRIILSFRLPSMPKLNIKDILSMKFLIIVDNLRLQKLRSKGIQMPKLVSLGFLWKQTFASVGISLSLFFTLSLSAQNVGIGTTSPVSKLDVVGGGIRCQSIGYGYLHTDLTTSMGTFVDASAGWLGTFSAHPIYFFTGDGDPSMVIQHAGNKNVGIGTTAPTAKLEIVDNHTTAAAMRVIKNYSAGANADIPAVYGQNTVDNNYGVGVYGKGGYVGVYGLTHHTSGTGNYFGMYARAHGTNTGTNVGVAGLAETGNNAYGLFGVASGTQANYGVYGQASGGISNNAGYFLGDVQVQSNSTNPGTISSKNYPVGTLNNAAGIIGVNTVDNGYGVGIAGHGGSIGVQGIVSTPGGQGPHKGIFGQVTGNTFQSNIGVHGTASNSSTGNFGVKGEANSPGAFINAGIQGTASQGSLYNYGVQATASGATSGYGIHATANGTGANYGVYGTASGGVENYAGYFVGDTYVTSSSPNEHALRGIKSHAPGESDPLDAYAGVYGENTVDEGIGVGVYGNGGKVGVVGACTSEGTLCVGVAGQVAGDNNVGSNVGVLGQAIYSENNVGVRGESLQAAASNKGVLGSAKDGTNNYAVSAEATGNTGTKYGVHSSASGTGTNYAIWANASGGTTNYAGYFTNGNVYMQEKLGVGEAPGDYKMLVKHGTYGLKIQHTTAGTKYLEIYQTPSSGNLELWTSAGSIGNFNYTSGSYSATSDRRLKQNIHPLISVLPDVMKLQANNYTYKTDPDQKPCIGFIAQDVEAIFPQLVTPPITGERETPYTMDYSGFGVLAIKAIQEQQAIIEGLEDKVARMELLLLQLIESSDKE